MRKLSVPCQVPKSNDEGFLDRYIKSTGKRYIFGRTEQTLELLDRVPCDYVIDTFTKERFFRGIEIVGLNDVKEGAKVLSAVMHRPITVKKILDDLGIDNSSYYWIEANEKIDLPTIEYWKGARGHFHKNKKRYEMLYEILEDSESKYTLEAILSFRETGNLEYMKSFTTKLDDMYFESFLNLKPKPIFIDIGALDGKNSFDFIKKYPDYEAIYAIEPLPSYAEEIKSKTNTLDNFIVLNYAISNHIGPSILYVKDNGASSSIIGDRKGKPISIKCETIDNLTKHYKIEPDFIKMDIEGAEMDALQGGLESIKHFQPALAVSVYHNTDHILDSWNLLRSISPNYRFYLRHYTEGFAETVLYAVI